MKAILFDLDDTLLGNDIAGFLPAYLGILGKFSQDLPYDGNFVNDLLAAVQYLVMSSGKGRRNVDRFWDEIERRTGLQREPTAAFFEGFYEDVYPVLQKVVTSRPSAKSIIDLAFKHDLHVVIATNPLFPTTAIEQRLAWGGVPVTRYDYALVTTLDNMDRTKPHPAYYTEILDRCNLKAADAIMVGNSWESDLLPALAVGMRVYQIGNEDGGEGVNEGVLGRGSLSDFHAWLQSTLPH